MKANERPGAGVDLFSGEDGRGYVRDLIDSREWWVFPWVSERAAGLCAAIEEEHYAGEASADFLLMMGSGEGLGSRLMVIAFARKRRMSPAQLARLLGLPIAAQLATQDLLVAADGPNDDAAAAGAQAFYDWVMGDDGWTPKGTVA